LTTPAKMIAKPTSAIVSAAIQGEREQSVPTTISRPPAIASSA
jgi:hypothetical protein